MGYLLEVAPVDGDITHNWRVRLGAASDDAGNEPHTGPKDSQVLSLAAVMEVVVSRLHGRSLSATPQHRLQFLERLRFRS